jgi:hypothetical protein
MAQMHQPGAIDDLEEARATAERERAPMSEASRSIAGAKPSAARHPHRPSAGAICGGAALALLVGLWHAYPSFLALLCRQVAP